MGRNDLEVIMITQLVVLLAVQLLAVLSCNHGWVSNNGNCYMFSHNEVTWTAAQTECTFFGASLMEPRTADRHTFLEQQLRAQQKDDLVWIGLNDIEEEGKWRWLSDDTDVTTAQGNWRAGDPNNGDGDPDTENCVAVNWTDSDDDLYNAEWVDLQCYEKHFYACEKADTD